MAGAVERKREAMRARHVAGDSIAQIAKDFMCKEETVRKHVTQNKQVKGQSIQSEDKKQTYRENLAWAIDAAGNYLRSRQLPTICPNNAAYFLFRQAIKDPKDFLGKVGQIERDNSGDDSKEDKKSTKKTLSEIQSFLEGLSNEEEKRNATKEEAKATT